MRIRLTQLDGKLANLALMKLAHYPPRPREEEGGMNLYLRKVVHSQAHDNYRIVLKRDGDEFEIGSIGIQDGAAWAWGIDTVIPMREQGTQGEAAIAGTA